MENSEYLLQLSAIILLIGGVTVSLATGRVFVLGLAGIFGYWLLEQAESFARKKGRTRRFKVLQNIAQNFFVTGLIASTVLFSTETWGSLVAVGSSAIASATGERFQRELRSRVTSIFSERERVFLTGISLMATYLNEHLLFYGLLLVALVSLLEVVEKTWKSIKL